MFLEICRHNRRNHIFSVEISHNSNYLTPMPFYLNAGRFCLVVQMHNNNAAGIPYK
jgi:hypothetical protein